MKLAKLILSHHLLCTLNLLLLVFDLLPKCKLMLFSCLSLLDQFLLFVNLQFLFVLLFLLFQDNCVLLLLFFD